MNSLYKRARILASNDWVIITCLMIVATLLSVFFFMNQSLRLDEAQSLWQTARTPKGILKIIAEDVHVPLYHQLLHLWRIYFGYGVHSARAMSLFFYLLSIPGIYILGKYAYSRNIGIWGAVLLTFSPFVSWYGNEVRMYSLFMVLTIANQYFFIRFFKSRELKSWPLYCLTALAGVYTHYFFILGLLAQAVFYFLNQKLFPKGAFARLAATAAIVVTALIPWIGYVFFLNKASNQDPLLSSPSTVDLFNIFAQFFTGFQIEFVNTIFLSLWPLALIFGLLGLRRDVKTAPESHYFLLAVLVPIATAFLISITYVPLFISRYLILTVPALYLAILSLIDNYQDRTAKVLRVFLLALMISMLIAEIFSQKTPVKENYREVTTFLNEHVRPQDAVIISPPFTLYPIEYYYAVPVPLSTLPAWDQFGTDPIPEFSEETLPDQVQDIVENAENVWVVLSYDQGYEETIQTYFDTRYERLYAHEFSPGLTLYEYRIRYDTGY